MIFVTDRTNGDKYNIDDLNRVEGNVFLISELLNQYGYGNVKTVKTNWLRSDFPKATDMTRYINNVNEIKDSFFSLAPLPPTDMNNIDYVDANNIEKTLESVYNLIGSMEKEFIYMGQGYMGEDIVLI